MTKPVVRIIVIELDFMPSAVRWAVDYFPPNGEHYMDMTRFFPTEELAIDKAESSAKELDFVRLGDHTWEKAKEETQG